MRILSTRRTGGSKILGSIALVVTTAFLASCGSTTAGKPAAGEYDVRKLSIGKYPTEPIDLRSRFIHSPSTGLNLAIGRLADAVVFGADVDPTFTHGVLSQSLGAGEGLGLVMSKAAEAVADDNHMMFGFSASTSTKKIPISPGTKDLFNYSPFGGKDPDPDADSFNVTVLQFPDTGRAATAADQMEAADFNVAPDQNQRITLDKQPAAKAHWRPGIPTLGTTIAHGQYVVSVFVQRPKPEIGGLKDLTEKVLATQLPMLDQTPALSLREMLRLDYDPLGVLRRALHPGTYPAPDAENEVTHTPRGFLHNVEDQGMWKKMLDNDGVDRTATTRNGALLLRARDADAAAALWSGITSAADNSINKSAEVPDTSCYETRPVAKVQPFTDSEAWDDSARFICTLHYDRYVARVAGTQLADVVQRAAAQYTLLANSQYM